MSLSLLACRKRNHETINLLGIMSVHSTFTIKYRYVYKRWKWPGGVIYRLELDVRITFTKLSRIDKYRVLLTLQTFLSVTVSLFDFSFKFEYSKRPSFEWPYLQTMTDILLRFFKVLHINLNELDSTHISNITIIVCLFVCLRMFQLYVAVSFIGV